MQYVLRNRTWRLQQVILASRLAVETQGLGIREVYGWKSLNETFFAHAHAVGVLRTLKLSLISMHIILGRALQPPNPTKRRTWIDARL
jgi:hypothetical protein